MLSSTAGAGGGFNLLLDSPVTLRSLRDIQDSYQIWLLDQFGCVHNGQAALPGAVDAVKSLTSSGAQVVVCSNSSQRKSLAMQRWASLGFPVEGVEFLTSGDCSNAYVQERIRELGWSKVFTFGWDNPALTSHWLQELPLTQVSSPEEADFVLFHGPETMGPVGAPTEQKLRLAATGQVDEVAVAALRRAVARDIPAVCANQDLQAVSTDGSIRHMPGHLARCYAQLGGRVASFGKPNREFLEAALALGVSALQAREQASGGLQLELVRHGDRAKNLPRPGVRRLRAIHCGDSLEHDVAGAAGAGIDSLLVTKHGIHKADLHGAEGEGEGGDGGGDGSAAGATVEGGGCGTGADAGAGASLLRRVTDLCAKEGRQGPSFILPELRL